MSAIYCALFLDYEGGTLESLFADACLHPHLLLQVIFDTHLMYLYEEYKVVHVP